MRRLLIVSLVLAALAATSPRRAAIAAAPQDALNAISAQRRALFNAVAPGVVYLESRAGIGSGFFVNERGLVLTNHHVVGNSDMIRAVLHNGRVMQGRVVARASEGTDLALVQLPLERSPALTLRDVNAVHIGDWAGSVNHGHGGVWTFNDGMISNIYPMRASTPVIQTQLPLNPGASGGPLFDSQGRVFGVVTAGIRSANNINFALRLDAAFEALPSMLDQIDVMVIRAPDNVPIFLDDVQVGLGPRAVVPVSRGRHDVFIVSSGVKRQRAVEFPATRTVDLSRRRSAP